MVIQTPPDKTAVAIQKLYPDSSIIESFIIESSDNTDLSREPVDGSEKVSRRPVSSRINRIVSLLIQ